MYLISLMLLIHQVINLELVKKYKQPTGTFMGDSNTTETGFYVIRLGDT